MRVRVKIEINKKGRKSIVIIEVY
jgi:hypothetical protein